jgi:hypothetical protein
VSRSVLAERIFAVQIIAAALKRVREARAELASNITDSDRIVVDRAGRAGCRTALAGSSRSAVPGSRPVKAVPTTRATTTTRSLSYPVARVRAWEIGLDYKANYLQLPAPELTLRMDFDHSEDQEVLLKTA